jgi:hypothetical protein
MTFSMFQLSYKDHHTQAFFFLMSVQFFLIGEFSSFFFLKSLKQDEREESFDSMVRCARTAEAHMQFSGMQKKVKILNFLGMMAWFLVWQLVEPPKALPDLIWVAQNAFCLAWWVVLQAIVLWQMKSHAEEKKEAKKKQV